MPASSIPHSFVSADLFDVVGMSAIPNHVLKHDFDTVDCPTCGGDGWLLSYLSDTWTTGDTFAPCKRCHMTGEMLGVEDRRPKVRTE